MVSKSCASGRKKKCQRCSISEKLFNGFAQLLGWNVVEQVASFRIISLFREAGAKSALLIAAPARNGAVRAVAIKAGICPPNRATMRGLFWSDAAPGAFCAIFFFAAARCIIG